MRSLLHLLARRGSGPGSEAEGEENPGARLRRVCLYIALGLAAFCALLVLAALYTVYVEPYWIKYHDVEIRLPDLPDELDGFTIALVADIHCGRLFPPERVRDVMNRVRARRPDAVVIAGDLVQERAACEGVFKEIDRIAREIPTYVVPGNHDYWQGIDQYRRLISGSAATDLTNAHRVVGRENAHRVIGREGARLVIAGVDDFTDGEPDLEKTLAGVDPAKQPVLLLMHNPDFFPEVLARAPGVDLVLAGHTHGGQVRLPLVGPLVLPVEHREYAAGLVREGATQMYVSRGVGMLMKLRLGCRPEVPFIVLRSE